jgi:hypothetical protein
MNQNGTGVVYPTIELGGVTYELRITRGALLYRISKNQVDMNDLGKDADPRKRVAAVFDVLHAIIADKFQGSVEDLADVVIAEGKMKEATVGVLGAVGKVFPPAEPATPAVEATPEKPTEVVQ